MAAYLNKEGVPVTIFHGDQSVRLVCETPCVSDSQVRTGEAKCCGRLALEEKADNPYIVDPSQGHPVPDIFFREVRHIDLFATRLNN